MNLCTELVCVCDTHCVVICVSVCVSCASARSHCSGLLKGPQVFQPCCSAQEVFGSSLRERHCEWWWVVHIAKPNAADQLCFLMSRDFPWNAAQMKLLLRSIDYQHRKFCRVPRGLAVCVNNCRLQDFFPFFAVPVCVSPVSSRRRPSFFFLLFFVALFNYLHSHTDIDKPPLCLSLSLSHNGPLRTFVLYFIWPHAKGGAFCVNIKDI